MANKRSPGLSPIVLRKKFGAGMTTRNLEDSIRCIPLRKDDLLVSVHPERNGETHGGLYASQESYNRLPAAR